MNKEKLTVTIKKDLIDKIDSIIDKKKIKDRDEATEFLIIEGLGLNKIKKAFIQAGGMGMRLRPFTLEIPKPLIPLQGRPLIQHSLELLKSHGITEIYIAIGYKGEQIKNYFGDGKTFGLNIKYIEEKEPLGTAGALKLAKKYLDETFLLVWCDILADINLDDFVAFHKKNGGVATMALSPVEDVTQFGIAELKDSKIINFVEKPSREEAPSNLNNAGYTILEPEVFKYFPDKKVISIEREVYPKIVSAGEMFGYPFPGQWYDTGTHEAYEKAIMEWKGHRAGKK
jgi:NDP-sugar pyrophosphorylase family protein